MSDLEPCAADLREWFYQDEGGHVRWAKQPSTRVKAGDIAGHIVTKGYRQVVWRGHFLMTHRIAFALANGRWPSGQIDHINGQKTDNRLCNLREATNQENSFNRPSKNSSTGIKGVSLHRGRYIARCSRDGVSYHLGCFDTAEAAQMAYASAVERLHGDFAFRSTTEGTDARAS